MNRLKTFVHQAFHSKKLPNKNSRSPDQPVHAPTHQRCHGSQYNGPHPPLFGFQHDCWQWDVWWYSHPPVLVSAPLAIVVQARDHEVRHVRSANGDWSRTFPYRHLVVKNKEFRYNSIFNISYIRKKVLFLVATCVILLWKW